MVERCARISLTSGPHVAYIEGFQAGGGIGMTFRYSGADTGYAKVLVKAGVVATNNLYNKQCDPTAPGAYASPTKFTMCVFKSDNGLQTTPTMGLADTAGSTLHYVGKGQLPVIDLDSLSEFRNYVPDTPVTPPLPLAYDPHPPSLGLTRST